MQKWDLCTNLILGWEFLFLENTTKALEQWLQFTLTTRKHISILMEIMETSQKPIINPKAIIGTQG